MYLPKTVQVQYDYKLDALDTEHTQWKIISALATPHYSNSVGSSWQKKCMTKARRKMHDKSFLNVLQEAYRTIPEDCLKKAS